MSIVLVNTKPGDIPGRLVPGRPVDFGFRNTDIRSSLRLNSLNILGGMSRFTGAGIPVPVAGSSVALVTVGDGGYASPTGTVSTSSGLSITKGYDTEDEAGIYRVHFPCDANSTALALVRFRVSPDAWRASGRRWSQSDGILPPFLALRHDGLGGRVCAYLRQSGGSYGATLEGLLPDQIPGQRVMAPPYPGSPSSVTLALRVSGETGTVELFGSIDDLPLQGPLVTTSMESLVGSSTASGDGVSLFFGNCGVANTSVVVEEWGLYPDFPNWVQGGMSAPSVTLQRLPDSPCVYDPKGGYTPEEYPVHPWRPVGSTLTSLHPSIGNPALSEAFDLKRTVYPAYLFRAEARVGFSSGSLLEAAIKIPGAPAGVRGPILRIADAVRQYDVGIDIGQGEAHLTLAGQEVSFSPDAYTDLRMCLDPRDHRVHLLVNGVHALSAPDSDFPPRSGDPGFYVGFLQEGTPATLRIRHLEYLTDYHAWEGSGGQMPNSSELLRIYGSDEYLENGSLVLDKGQTGYGLTGGYRVDALMQPWDGLWAEFSVQAEYAANHRDASGRLDTGIGFFVDLPGQSLRLGLFSCGLGGRRIGVVPGSGSPSDILDLTALGRAFSTPADWRKEQVVRVEYRGGDSIKIWVNSLRTSDPQISIPFNPAAGRFDLPQTLIAQDRVGISFGYSLSDIVARTRWRFFRWGLSKGFDFSLSRKYPQGFSPYLFGGKFLLLPSISTTEENP